METYRERVADAVRDDEWQRFRESLKGTSTDTKLRQLRQFWINNSHKPKARVQIDNYLKALCRGGLLYEGESFETAIEHDFILRVKKG